MEDLLIQSGLYLEELLNNNREQKNKIKNLILKNFFITYQLHKMERDNNIVLKWGNIRILNTCRLRKLQINKPTRRKGRKN